MPGDRTFVAPRLAPCRRRHHLARPGAPRPLSALADWGADLATLCRLRVERAGHRVAFVIVDSGV
ncbi:MAG: hypothetical protein LBI02_04335 [Opitutaceae bacterium]|nr:hypothetical protein [Opitutaceae bacterium]